MRTFRLVMMALLRALHPPWPAMSRPAERCARSISAPIRYRRGAIRRPARAAGRPRISPAKGPYRGGSAVVSDLLGGQVQVFFGTTSLTAEQVRADKLRALAVTGATRWEGLPDVPPVGDFVSGYEASSLFGLGAPKQTPSEIIDRLN